MKYTSYTDFCKDVKNNPSSFCREDINSFIFHNDASFSEYSVLPGFVDVHVHLREPGFFYKESIATGTAAAAHGGYTTVLSMPNLNPVPDSVKNLNVQIEAIKNSALINVLPYGALTVGENGEKLSDMEDLSPFVAAFSDDGKGVQNDEIMLGAMQTAKKLGKIIAAHCEDNSLLCGGYIHKGEYARQNNHKGISSESEYSQIARDIKIVRQTGCAYHVCHVSAKESVELIRNAKREGLNITCETAPHYLLLDDSMLKDEGRFKMNPPVRSRDDKIALIEGITDGTIDMLATDHAPHSAEEKSKGLKGSLMGIVGLETAFPLMYTNFVKTNILSIDKLMDLMCFNPARRFNIDVTPNNYSVWALNESYVISSDSFLSKGKSTPFENYKVFGKCICTVCENKTVYKI